jgi:FkbM family methyltransferase
MRQGVGAIAKLRATAGFVRVVRNWPWHYVVTHVVPRSTPLVYRLRDGVELEGRSRTLDVAVLKDVFVHQIYTPEDFAIRSAWVVVDIGAHIGAFATYAARAADSVAVFAFEPHPENFALLSRNIARNGLSSVRAFPVAVSGSSGDRDLYLSNSHAGHSLRMGSHGDQRLVVPSRSLTDVMADNRLDKVDLVKMDCEGAEYEILEATAPDQLRRIRRIALEAHTVDALHTPGRAVSALENSGFDVQVANKNDGTAMIWAKRMD